MALRAMERSQVDCDSVRGISWQHVHLIAKGANAAIIIIWLLAYEAASGRPSAWSSIPTWGTSVARTCTCYAPRPAPDQSRTSPYSVLVQYAISNGAAQQPASILLSRYSTSTARSTIEHPGTCLSQNRLRSMLGSLESALHEDGAVLIR